MWACLRVARRVLSRRVLLTLCVRVWTQAFPSYIMCIPTYGLVTLSLLLSSLTLLTMSNPGPSLILLFPWVRLQVCPLPITYVEKVGGIRRTLLTNPPSALLISLWATRLAGQAVLTLRLRLQEGAAVFNWTAVMHLPARHRNLLTCPAVPFA